MTRIISGNARGRRLEVPKSGTRPTSDRVREALFSRFESLKGIKGSSFLDLYAGSGAVGFEAASRGAKSVDLVDKSDSAYKCLVKNRDSIIGDTQETVIHTHRSSANSFLETSRSSWDAVFIDPPYEFERKTITEVLVALTRHLQHGAVIAVERSIRDDAPTWPSEYQVLEPKDYGETRIYWLKFFG